MHAGLKGRPSDHEAAASVVHALLISEPSQILNPAPCTPLTAAACHASVVNSAVKIRRAVNAPSPRLGLAGKSQEQSEEQICVVSGITL